MTEETVRDPSEERRDWLEARRGGLFATDTPKVLGLSRWGTALSVYRDKLGDSEPSSPSLPAWLGLKMESVVAELYAQATGVRVRAERRTLMHPKTTFPMGSHFDFRARGRPKLLVECKTRAYMKGFGEDGSTEIPADIWAQVQHEMCVAGAEECHVAVLFGHHSFRVYPIKRDQQFLDKLLPKLEAFWFEHIVPGVPPLPSGHDLDSDYVKQSNPDHDETLKAATPEQEALIGKLRQATVNVQQAEVIEAELENRVKLLIGDSAGIEGSFGKITWRKTKDGESIDWEQVAVNQGNVLEELFLLAHPEGDEEVARYARAQAATDVAVSLATYPKPGVRRFLKDFRE